MAVGVTDDFDEEDGEGGVEDHLEDGVDGNEDGAVFVVPACEAGPDENLFVLSVHIICKSLGFWGRISVPLQCTSQVQQESDLL